MAPQHLKSHFRRRRLDNKCCNVLVVEDEGLIAYDIASRMEAMGHQVVATVASGEDALAKAPEADIVLMDIRIDGPIDGIETATRIREQFQLPVILLTAHADRSTIARAELSGFFDYIVKPIAYESLKDLIEITLNRHPWRAGLEGR
jgi:CheY-like chemotaxis protein